MGSDKARRTYDASRMYRSVVSQQGRVTLESDSNEAEEIRSQEARAALIDVVGPTGSPDNGFEISVTDSNSGQHDFAIGAGTFYLGGLRIENGDRCATYFGQRDTEWAESFYGPDPIRGKFTEVVYLEVAEQEVSAVEDPALREVALGGPDTAARTRLIQRVKRMRIDTEKQALKQLITTFHQSGLAFDEATMQLRSRMQLKVDFVPSSDSDSPCEPTAQAGFLGAENQLIRVMVTKAHRMLWGYDNASSLFRVTVTSSTTLRLDGIPVDTYHQPRPGQWIEVLGTAVVLDDDACIASDTGRAQQVESYEPGMRIVTLTNPLPQGIYPRQVFLRVWENRQTLPVDGTTAIELRTPEDVGLGVRVCAKGYAANGDYWMIGLRPRVPQAVFPRRLSTFQPPDGPRRWMAPLAIVSWKSPGVAEVCDCRRRFENLVELTEQSAGGLRKHHQRLHGWGIVCGLQVHCAEESEANEGGYVTIHKGSALTCQGDMVELHEDEHIDLIAQVEAHDETQYKREKPILDKNGNGCACVFLDSAPCGGVRFNVEKYEGKRPNLLEGTLWQDFYDEYVKSLTDGLKEYLNEGPLPGSDDVVGQGPKSQVALLTLFAPFIFERIIHQRISREVFISPSEHELLQALYEKLRDLLASPTYCMMFDGQSYPSYPFTTGRFTIFGGGKHTRMRQDGHGRAFTCRGADNTIHVYDLERGIMIQRLEMPHPAKKRSQVVVEDVAISPDGKKLFAIGWGEGSDSYVAVAELSALASTATPAATRSSMPAQAPVSVQPSDGFQWKGMATVHDVELVTLVAVAIGESCNAYAIGRNRGLFRLPICAMVCDEAPCPAPLYAFNAVQDLVVSPDGTWAYATASSGSIRAEAYDQVVSLKLDSETSGQAPNHVLPLGGLGQDDGLLYQEPGRLYVGCGEFPKNVHRIEVVGRGELSIAETSSQIYSSRIGLGYHPGLNRLLVSSMDEFCMIGLDAEDLSVVGEKSYLQPFPHDIAVSDEGERVYVLNEFVSTICSIPKGELDTSLDIAALYAYRLAAFQTFVELLGMIGQYLKDGFCDLLLVRCGECSDPEQKIYLACVELRERKVRRICNLSKRKYVHSFPTVEYWLSVLPIIPLVKQWVQEACGAVLPNLFLKWLELRDPIGKWNVKSGLNGVRVMQAIHFNKRTDYSAIARDAISARSGALGIALEAALAGMQRIPESERGAPSSTVREMSVDDAAKFLDQRGVKVRIERAAAGEPATFSDASDVVFGPSRFPKGSSVVIKADGDRIISAKVDRSSEMLVGLEAERHDLEKGMDQLRKGFAEMAAMKTELAREMDRLRPVTALAGVDERLVKQFQQRNILTLGDLAATTEEHLTKNGRLESAVSAKEWVQRAKARIAHGA